MTEIRLDIDDRDFKDKMNRFASQVTKTLTGAMMLAFQAVGLKSTQEYMTRSHVISGGTGYNIGTAGSSKLNIRSGRLARSLIGGFDFSGGSGGQDESIREIQITGNTITGTYGTSVPYACILGSRVKVRTKKGLKGIGQIKVGDYVLTQNGKFKKVIQTNRFPASEKPNMVTIVSEYRKNKNHKITLTDDHKVLVCRNGLNKWVKAIDIKLTDELYSPIKIPHNKGIWKDSLICEVCGKEFKRQPKRKHCSQKCKMIAWNENHPHIGMKRTEETKRKLKEIQKRRAIERPETLPNHNIKKITSHEKQIIRWLDVIGVEYETQYFINGYWVDFYVPDLKMIIEADGGHWHQDQKKDIDRDKKIRKSLADDWVILHFHFTKDPIVIHPNPIENVHYILCNDSINSYADLKTFKKIKIIDIINWKWEKSKKKRASRVPMLYDIGVQDVHSYVASGIIVSNSIHEKGGTITGNPYLIFRIGPFWYKKRSVTIPARPFLEPALEDSETNIHGIFQSAMEALAFKVSDK